MTGSDCVACIVWRIAMKTTVSTLIALSVSLGLQLRQAHSTSRHSTSSERSLLPLTPQYQQMGNCAHGSAAAQSARRPPSGGRLGPAATAVVGTPTAAVPIEPLPMVARWSQQIWPFALPRFRIEQTNVSRGRRLQRVFRRSNPGHGSCCALQEKIAGPRDGVGLDAANRGGNRSQQTTALFADGGSAGEGVALRVQPASGALRQTIRVVADFGMDKLLTRPSEPGPRNRLSIRSQILVLPGKP